MCNQAHELGSRDRHPLARLQRYYHIDETLCMNIISPTGREKPDREPVSLQLAASIRAYKSQIALNV